MTSKISREAVWSHSVAIMEKSCPHKNEEVEAGTLNKMFFKTSERKEGMIKKGGRMGG